MGWISWAQIPADESQIDYVVNFRRFEMNDETRLLALTEKTLWSPIVWRGDYRKRANFEYSDYCALDFENELVGIDEVARAFADSWHIIGTTRNHRLQKGDECPRDRFRLITKWSERITSLELYEANVKRLARKYGADLAATDGAKRFLPSKYYSHLFGEDLYPEPVLPPEPKVYAFVSVEYEARYHKRGKLTPQTDRALRKIISSGTRNITFFLAACELARANFSMELAAEMIMKSPTVVRMRREMPLFRLTREIKGTIKSAYRNVEAVIIKESSK